MSKYLDELNPTQEMIEIARELLENAKGLNTCKPDVDISASVKGLGAVMQELDSAGEPLSPSELSQRTHVSDARIANILRVLQERGLVERKQSVADKRRAEVSLTEKGVSECTQHRAELERAVAAFLTRLGKEDAQELNRLLARIRKTLTAVREEGYEPRPSMEVELSQGGEA